MLVPRQGRARRITAIQTLAPDALFPDLHGASVRGRGSPPKRTCVLSSAAVSEKVRDHAAYALRAVSSSFPK
jgi:hypothetical protein